jgi:hypothetical protein
VRFDPEGCSSPASLRVQTRERDLDAKDEPFISHPFLKAMSYSEDATPGSSASGFLQQTFTPWDSPPYANSVSLQAGLLWSSQLAQFSNPHALHDQHRVDRCCSVGKGDYETHTKVILSTTYSVLADARCTRR